MAWYEESTLDDGAIISSRVRLARNFGKYPFKKKLTHACAAKMVEEVAGAIQVNSEKRAFFSLDMDNLSAVEKKVFIEKHIVSNDFLFASLPKVLLISENQSISVMVNEEDHLRIQAVFAGDSMARSYDAACRLDDLIEEKMDYAFHADYGYLTACPTNTGTGMRASYMVHLPCIDRDDIANKLMPHVAKFGITLRGIHGEGTAPLGSIYQISNQATLGKTEEEIMDGLESVTKTILDHERKNRENLLENKPHYIKDKVCRSYGILASARLISANEAISLLSDVRLGFMLGLFDRPRPHKSIYQIMMEIQPGHLQRAVGMEMDEQGRDLARADFLRGIFV